MDFIKTNTLYLILLQELQPGLFVCGVLDSHPYEPLIDDNGVIIKIKLDNIQDGLVVNLINTQKTIQYNISTGEITGV